MSTQALQLHRTARILAKRAEDVAAQIETHIMELGWPAGQVLGSERELVERYKVSRASLREAVRLLEYHKVARMRPGPHGGLMVMEPDAEVVARAMALFLSHGKVTAGQLLEMRGIIEGQAAALAATTASAAERKELMAMVSDRGRGESASCQALDFHIRVAQLSRNLVMELFVRCLTALTGQRATLPRAGTRGLVQRVNEIHHQIAEAIAARDPELARRRMTRHIHAIDEFLDEPVPRAAQ